VLALRARRGFVGWDIEFTYLAIDIMADLGLDSFNHRSGSPE
jgi:hypothetical protein